MKDEAHGSVEIRVLTERKILPVVSGVQRGAFERVEVDVCVQCGAVVFDPIRHDNWHLANANKEN